jgi:hypothetical protein
MPSIRSKLIAAILVLLAAGCSSPDGEPSDDWSLEDRADAADVDARADVGADADVQPRSDARRDPDVPPQVDIGLDSGVDAPVDAAVDAQGCGDVRARLVVGESASGTLGRGRGAVDETSCASAIGEEHTYALEVPERTAVRVWTAWENDETQFSPVLTLLDGCEGQQELACSDPLARKPDGLNGLIRTTLDAGTYRLRVDERSNLGFGEGGAYVVHTEAIELAENSMCAGAELLQAGQDPLLVTDADQSTFGATSACFDTLNFARFYAVDVPPEHTAHARTAHTNSEYAPWVAMATSCEAEDCALSSGLGLASLSNTSDETARFLIVVRNSRQLDYEIEVDVDPMLPNAWCEQAIELTSGGQLEPVDWSGALANARLCNGDRRNKLFYTVDVPPNHRLFTYGGADAPYGPPVRVQESCDASTCVQRRYVNEQASGQEVVIVANSDGIGTSELGVEAIELDDHAQCTSPRLVNIGETVSDENIRRGGELYNPCNLVASPGNVYTLYYRVDIPLGQGAVTIRAQAADSDNLSASLQAFALDDAALCGAAPDPTCVAVDDSYFRPTPDAEITIDASFGGGRNPAPALIAVTMSPGLGPLADGGHFDFVVEQTQ